MSSPRWIVNSDCRKSALIRLQTITWVGELASGIFGRLLAIATFRCKNTFSNFGDRCKLPRPSGSTERCSIFGISRYSVFVFRPRGLRLWSPLALLGQKFAHVNQIIRNHAPPDPSFHPIHPSVTTPPQPMPSLENTDPPFASHSPTLCPPKPTLLFLLPSV